jgi:pyridoxamine-phosphate oxidase
MALHSTKDKIQIIPHNQYNTADSITPFSLSPSPLDQFKSWFTEIQGTVPEPEAMTLSTATASGIPSSRIVLLKQLDSTGFVFYTNYTSRKSKELLQNPHASLVFYWKEVHRQVRILGTVEQVTRNESEMYFHSRPAESQLGAWASKQSSVIGEGEIEQRMAKYTHMFPTSSSLPLPEFWGGWRLIPTYV